jgi:hypothetical protein
VFWPVELVEACLELAARFSITGGGILALSGDACFCVYPGRSIWLRIRPPACCVDNSGVAGRPLRCLAKLFVIEEDTSLLGRRVRTGEVVRDEGGDTMGMSASEEGSRDKVGFVWSACFGVVFAATGGPSDFSFMSSAKCRCSASKSSKIRIAWGR